MIVAVLLCCLLFSAVVVWTEDSPVYVLRADIRPPNDVFLNGFRSLGDNDNLLDHVSGASCQTATHQGTTVFIDTTTNLLFAKAWGEQLLSKTNILVPPTTNFYYVYVIHANSNFFNCEASLWKEADSLHDKSLHNTIVYLNQIYHVKQQSRWLAYYEITGYSISSAFIFAKENITDTTSSSELSGYVQNPKYMYGGISPQNIRANSEPYSRRGPAAAHITACLTYVVTNDDGSFSDSRDTSSPVSSIEDRASEGESPEPIHDVLQDELEIDDPASHLENLLSLYEGSPESSIEDRHDGVSNRESPESNDDDVEDEMESEDSASEYDRSP